jgi:hypothetical protein
MTPMTPDAPLLPAPPPAAPSPLPTPKSLTASDLLSQMIPARDLAAESREPLPWLWHGFLSPGKVTLLTSQWKAGKTTLLSILLARLRTGGQLAGLPVAAGKALVVSEESRHDWRPRCQRLGLLEHVHFLCRPFKAKPTMEEWLTLMDAVDQSRRSQGIDLVVFDTLATFLPGQNENTAGTMLQALMPLRRLADVGMSLLLMHHPRKGTALAGQAARGSGALPAFVDILIEKSYVTDPDDPDRRRRLRAYTRHEETARHLVLELTADGTDYLVHNVADEEMAQNWQAVLFVLEEATTKLTRQEILEHWPADFDKPDKATLWRWLVRAVAQGGVLQEGSGRNKDPFRYWLPDRQEMLHPGPGASPEAMAAWNERVMRNLLDSLGK